MLTRKVELALARVDLAFFSVQLVGVVGVEVADDRNAGDDREVLCEIAERRGEDDVEDAASRSTVDIPLRSGEPFGIRIFFLV